MVPQLICLGLIAGRGWLAADPARLAGRGWLAADPAAREIHGPRAQYYIAPFHPLTTVNPRVRGFGFPRHACYIILYLQTGTHANKVGSGVTTRVPTPRRAPIGDLGSPQRSEILRFFEVSCPGFLWGKWPHFPRHRGFSIGRLAGQPAGWILYKMQIGVTN